MNEGNVDAIKRRWTKDEIEYLEDRWGIIPIPCIAKNLNRSIESIKNKAYRIGLERHLHCREEITINQLFIALGISGSYSYSLNRMLNRGLPVIKKKSITKIYKMIKIDSFWEWAEQNRDILNFAKFSKGDLGKELDWVEEKRKADKLNPSKNSHNRRWSKEEDNLLISKVKSNRYTYSDLSSDLNRTENAIKRRLQDLKVPYRPVPRNNHKKWTEDENKRMVEMYKKGYDTFAIAKVLNKTQLSIGDRVKMFGL